MRQVVYQVEFVTGTGVRMGFDGERWSIDNIRQLGESARVAALALIERAEQIAARTPEQELTANPLVGRCEYVAKRLELRITHKRRKFLDDGRGLPR